MKWFHRWRVRRAQQLLGRENNIYVVLELLDAKSTTTKVPALWPLGKQTPERVKAIQEWWQAARDLDALKA